MPWEFKNQFPKRIPLKKHEELRHSIYDAFNSLLTEEEKILFGPQQPIEQTCFFTGKRLVEENYALIHLVPISMAPSLRKPFNKVYCHGRIVNLLENSPLTVKFRIKAELKALGDASFSKQVQLIKKIINSYQLSFETSSGKVEVLPWQFNKPNLLNKKHRKALMHYYYNLLTEEEKAISPKRLIDLTQGLRGKILTSE